MCLHRDCVNSWSGQLQCRKLGSGFTVYRIPFAVCDGTSQSSPVFESLAVAAICNPFCSRSSIVLLVLIRRRRHNRRAETELMRFIALGSEPCWLLEQLT